MESEKDNKPGKGYLSSAVDSLNPWAQTSRTEPQTKQPQTNPVSTAQGDHSTNHLYGQSTKSYPDGCPTLKVLWFHATDSPKRKPTRQKKVNVEDKQPPVPKKFVPFSQLDSTAIETTYQQLLEHGEKSSFPESSSKSPSDDSCGVDRASSPLRAGSVNPRVPVNEDYLFDVDIEKRELEPVFWLGPVFEVRRGTWFYQEGATLRPCDENLASQLEEGFLKVRPWLYSGLNKPELSRQPVEAPPDTTKDANMDNGTILAGFPSSSASAPASSTPQPASHRLFGAYMNSIVTYQDAATAWLSSDSMFSWVTSTVYQRFAGGGYMGGIKLVRGWSTTQPKPEAQFEAPDLAEKSTSTPSDSLATQQDAHLRRTLKRRSAPPKIGPESYDTLRPDVEVEANPSPDFPVDTSIGLLASEDRKFRDQAEEEIRHDYNGQSGESQGREIEHLVLVTHGIGQQLSMRMESLNFVHDVNIMRKTMKSTYANSADLRTLNSGAPDALHNCRVQVLPVCWRHLLEFPTRQRKSEDGDLGDLTHEEDDYPSLDDITIEGVTFVRSLVSDLALDVLLYQSAYRQLISKIVLKEANRIYHLFKARNPSFNGKVHVIGHSLGSAIMFDILCREKESHEAAQSRMNPLRFWPSHPASREPQEHKELSFNFDVEDFYCLGSPVGLFQMLKGRTISARHPPGPDPSQGSFDMDPADGPFGSSASPTLSHVTGLPLSVASPKVVQLYNIFHPSDPISYRLEPLISSTMSSLKPQVLPYTKKSIFGNVTPQGLSGIGSKVGQSVSGLWTSLSAGIASNILNRSLGLSTEDMARMSSASASTLGATAHGHEALQAASQLGEKTNERKRELADPSTQKGRSSLSGNEVTLIDDELETLFSNFQKKRSDMSATGNSKLAGGMLEQDTKAQKVRWEESKVRALNRNGRVDYSIQESALDFNPINTIASHMAYWADEDVNHFILSQLLSSQSKKAKDKATSTR